MHYAKTTHVSKSTKRDDIHFVPSRNALKEAKPYLIKLTVPAQGGRTGRAN